jgi:predicted kinase
MRVHYPRTAHLPWSPGATPDDIRAGDLRGLIGHEVVVTEKLDGENTTLYRDGLHARSLDSAHHPSRAWVKALQGRVGSQIPEAWRVCGENLHARHSIAYFDLDSWFYGFSVWDETDRCLDWDATERFLHGIGIPTPPVLWRGTFDEKSIKALRLDLSTQEGYVVRTATGFDRAEFTARVAKWVRPNHVQTDTHWMHAEVVPNGLGPSSTFWSIRSGLDVPTDDPVVEETLARLDATHRLGDVRLIAALAAAHRREDRTSIATRLANTSLGMPVARRVADLVGLHTRLHTPFPDEHRRSGLARMSLAADLPALHALAEAASDDAAAREQVQWSALYAEDAGLLTPEPWRPLQDGLKTELADLTPHAANRCWAQARTAWADGKLSSVEEAVAATWRWRDGDYPQLIQMVGPSGSGKSRLTSGLSATVVSMDDLREERGSRSDQRSNAEVLTAALAKLDSTLRTSPSVIWDATGLNRPQRNLVLRAAGSADAYVTQAVFLVDEPTLRARNADRANPVPDHVLTSQIGRFQPPYPGEAHRIWYLDGAGAIADADGEL